MFRSIAAAVIVAAMILHAAGSAADLSPKQQTDLDAAVTEFQKGAHLSALAKLAPLAAIETTCEAIESEFRRRELPGLGEMLARIRWEATRDGQSAKLPRPGTPELRRILSAFRQLLHDEMDRALAEPALGDKLPIPDKLSGFRDLFYQLDAAEMRLRHVAQAATHLRGSARTLAKADVERLPDDARALVENDELGALAESLATLERGIEERRVELSLGRMALAAGDLDQPMLTLRRLLAAADWNRDVQRVTAFLKKATPQSLLRPALKEPGLLKRVTADGEKVQRQAGQLLAKARLLADGVEWWLRGRYGVGDEQLGLVKSQQSVRSPTGRLLLHMPESPAPTDPFDTAAKRAAPFYHRRHLVVWAWNPAGQPPANLHRAGWTFAKHLPAAAPPQNSPVDALRGGSSAPASDAFTTIDDRFTQRSRWITDASPDVTVRLVGYVEYVLALNRFDQLAATASDAELSIIDQWVKEQDTLAIHVNLSRKFPQTATTAFAEWPLGPEDHFERRGLNWMMALARIELAAMRAAFAQDREAFLSLRPSTFETRAYEELLLDSARLQLWSFQADPLFEMQVLRQQAAASDTIAVLYERRTRLALAFIDAARQWLGPRANASQRNELQVYADRLTAIQSLLRTQVVRPGGANPIERRELINKTPTKNEPVQQPASKEPR